jgi:hypothetical protein
MTQQEMFDLSVRGLASQGWQASYVVNYGCTYHGEGGRRCAWGWIDLSLTDDEGGVATLKNRGIGIAATLNDDELEFASLLQLAHDETTNCDGGQIMLDSFIAIGQNHGLIWPADVSLTIQ